MLIAQTVPRTVWRSMTKGKILEGVFAINKPPGITSAQVIRDLQHKFTPSETFGPWVESEKKKREREKSNQRHRRKQKKVEVKIGHGGTLDPLATGVLITGVGKGTKLLQEFLQCTKEYEAIVLFGTSTDTYDRHGVVLKRAPYEHITKEKVEKALAQFRGKFKQTPPLYSALKMNGKPLYEYAREGKEIPREIEKRDVNVLKLELEEWMEGGTHEHVAPTDEAGHAEVNVANRLWAKGEFIPTGIDVGGDDTKKVKKVPESKKRKLGEKDDDLVTERPTSKQQKSAPETQDATMSGGLPLASASATPAAETPSEVSTAKATPIVAPEIPPAAEVTFKAMTTDAGTETTEAKPEITESPKPPVKGPPAIKLRMTVTSGFYVRSLCHDLGAALGSAALMAELKRTRQGEFEVGKNCLEYSDLEAGEEVWGSKVEGFLDDWVERHKPRALGEDVVKDEEAVKEGGGTGEGGS